MTEKSDLARASNETLQQHVDALNIIINIMLTAMVETQPQTAARTLDLVRKSIDSTPQLHPQLREQLELRYMSLAELLAGPGPMN